MHIIALLALGFAAVSAVPATDSLRIAGGGTTTIEAYPTIASVLYTWNWSAYFQACGGTILNNRSILTAASCPRNDPANRWRVRVGSSWANSAGVVHLVATTIIHPSFNLDSMQNDIAILRTSTVIVQNNAVRPASIAGANYNLADNQAVWAAGWGQTLWGTSSEQLRHVQLLTISQSHCGNIYYSNRGIVITENMLCAGWLQNAGRDQCDGDYGGPLYHNGVVVGVSSFGIGCGTGQFPSVNTRVSRYVSWIQSNA